MTGRVRTGHCVAALACAAALFLAGCDKEKGVPPPSNPVVQVIEAGNATSMRSSGRR
jgi:hypothetical protein